jgi:hypothetical protein
MAKSPSLLMPVDPTKSSYIYLRYFAMLVPPLDFKEFLG